MRVVRYQEAYRTWVEWDLCDDCADSTDEAEQARRKAGIGILGSVQYGEHEGTCDCCQLSQE